MRENYIIGNWKMNHGLKEVKDFFGVLKSERFKANCHTWIAPQFLHIPYSLELTQNMNFKIGSQNLSYETKGAFTGEVSANALKEMGASFTLIGHSERRSLFNETYEELRKKVELALGQNLIVVFCIGETLEERESGKTLDVLREQLSSTLTGLELDSKKFILAYEPVWAIGTGKTATPEQAEKTHQGVRNIISKDLNLKGEDFSILYGGSVKPSNVKDLMSQENIDGALVGGASLNPNDYRSLTEVF